MWLVLHKYIVRFLDNWEVLKNYFIFCIVEKKSKSVEIILDLLNNISIKAYLLFLKYSLNFLNSFNALFQSRKVDSSLSIRLSVSFAVVLYRALNGSRLRIESIFYSDVIYNVRMKISFMQTILLAYNVLLGRDFLAYPSLCIMQINPVIGREKIDRIRKIYESC